jgi:hypothetical protein
VFAGIVTSIVVNKFVLALFVIVVDGLTVAPELPYANEIIGSEPTKLPVFPL